jgi:hypothetical protein
MSRAMSQSTYPGLIESVPEKDLIGRISLGQYQLFIGSNEGFWVESVSSPPSKLEKWVAVNTPSQWIADSEPQLLDFQDVSHIVEEELGRSLTPPQEAALQELWQYLEGHAQLLRQIAAYSRESNFSFDQILFRIQQGDAVRSLTRLVLTPLPTSPRWIIALLTALKGFGIRADQIAGMIGPPNPRPSLEELRRRRLIQVVDDRYYLAPNLIEVLQENFNETPWMERVISYLLTWAPQHLRSPHVILEEQEMLIVVLEWAVRQKRWQEVLSLVRAIEGAFAIAQRWEVWRQILRWSLQAAWSIGDELAEAWALHQLGTLALCEEDVTTAYDSLYDAINLRTELGNEIGAQLSRHNMAVLKATLLPPPSVRQSSTHRIMWIALGTIGIGILVTSLWMQGAIPQMSPFYVEQKR